MASIQERLQIKREPLDKWSIREQLCLAFAVARSGDQNWMSVSRALKPFGDPNRPPDWFHQKNCAAQYGALLENVETPKRKKRVSGQEVGIETPAESILRKLTAERRAELKKLMAEERAEYLKLQEEMALLQSGNVSEEQLDQWCKEIDEEEKQKEEEALAHSQWLKERELRKQEIERVWRPVLNIKTPVVVGQKRKASDSVDSLIDGDNSQEISQMPVPESHPKPPISPLLTSLLKSPSNTQNIVTSSILHSAITNQRGSNSNSISNPTITSLLNSTTNVTVSPGLQQLVSSAIGQQPTILQPGNDMIDDTTDTLPNLKVEDIERTILSSDEPLPEIKNEEVEVIISDLIENAADIVTDPEQHLQLDGSDDIISNLENELDELVNEENAAKEEEARAEQARLEAIQRVEQERAEQERLKKEQIRQEQLKQEQLRQEQIRLEQEKQEQARLEKMRQEEMKRDLLRREQEKADAEKANQKPDPFEFEEDPVIVQTKPSSSFIKTQSISFHEEDCNKKDNQEVVNEDPKKNNSNIVPGSVEVVEVIAQEDENLDRELNKSQIQDIVHSNVPVKEETLSDNENENTELPIQPSPDSDNIKTDVEVKSELETNMFDEQVDSIEMEIKNIPSLEKKEPTSDQESERPTFTPEYPDDLFDDLNISVTKLDKIGKAKRDYTRKNKKEDKDLEMILSNTEPSDNADLGELTDTMSEKEFQDEKKDVKSKIKNDTERSSSPWTEEEEPLSKSANRRYSTPATPIDSIPNSPASGVTSEDDREYRNWKKSVMLVYSRLATHKYASLFLKPITNDQAPGYHGVVYRPMDLQTIRKNVETGVIRTTTEFQRDVLLMFNNAIMYNKTNDHVYNMALQMQKESLQQIQILLQVGRDGPIRRETRTSEPGSKRKRIGGGDDSVRPKKRKDD